MLLISALNIFIVSMLYLGKEQIQFSKTVDPRRAFMFCIMGRKWGEGRRLCLAMRKRKWAGAPGPRSASGFVNFRLCQPPTSSAALGNVSIFVHLDAVMSKMVCDIESPGCMFRTDTEPWGAWSRAGHRCLGPSWNIQTRRYNRMLT